MTMLKLPFPILHPGAAILNVPKMNYPYAMVSQGADAASEKIAYVGHILWADGSASKNLGSSAKVHLRASSLLVMADAATTVRVGLQGVLGSAGGVTAPTPDGSWSIYRDFAGNSGVVTTAMANTFISIALSTSGTPTVNNGQLISIVAEVTARGGTDNFSMSFIGGDGASGFPTTGQFTTSWLNGAQSSIPNCLLEADDGTLGILGGAFFSTVSDVSFSNTSNPDEYGLIFQVPYRCKTSAAYVSLAANNTNADGTITLYSDPLGTPTSMATFSYFGDYANVSTGNERPCRVQLSTEVELLPGVDYCLAFKSDTSTAISMSRSALASANHRAVQGLENCRQGTRNNSTGAFSEDTTIIPMICMELSHIAIAQGGVNFHLGMN